MDRLATAYLIQINFVGRKRTRGFEAKPVNVGRSGRNIRSPRVHVPPSLADTCQLRPVSRKAGRSDYIGSMPGRQPFQIPDLN